MPFLPASLLPLGAALLLLMIDSAIELAFISSMVGYLHRSGANQYPFTGPDGNEVLINAKPKGLLGNEGHTSNGAAGTSLVLICFGGFLALWRQVRRERHSEARGLSKIFITWTIFTILSFLLTVAALAYTFILIQQTSGQFINPVVALESQGHAYPVDKWTPQTWTKALLALPLISGTDASYLQHWLRVMEGWRWNLIPMMLINLFVAALAIRECLRQRRVLRDDYDVPKENVESS